MCMSFQRRKVVKALESNGCAFLREGSRHTIYSSRSGARVEVPRHAEIARGTARSIARQAGLARARFEQEIR